MKVRAAVLEAMGAQPPYAGQQAARHPRGRARLAGPGRGAGARRAAGLCHSDLSVVNGDRPRPMPMVLGHEAAGEVVEAGRRRRRPGAGRPRRDGVRAELRRIACPAPRAGRRCASPAPRPTARARCSAGDRRCIATGEPLNHHLGVSASPSTRWCRAARGQDRPDAAARRSGAVRLRGADRRRRGDQHRRRCRPGRAWPCSGWAAWAWRAARRGGRGRARDRRGRPLDDKLELARQLGATATFNARRRRTSSSGARAHQGRRRDAFEMAGSAAAFDAHGASRGAAARPSPPGCRTRPRASRCR